MKTFKCLLVCAHYALVHAPPKTSLSLGESLPCGVCESFVRRGPVNRVVVEITLAKNELGEGLPR